MAISSETETATPLECAARGDMENVTFLIRRRQCWHYL